ncbi:hypothetical protein CesoFtcFv8_001186 [Champsocephalus esox]|uniref:Uncharacterized protein n=1 Tax=Champsocephalus esox TaxID=159716 RepID=A0AAN8D6M6_9TELE|nr:hypothetical protein CesoFtcFv8_001186 [Champsocephalus esox]
MFTSGSAAPSATVGDTHIAHSLAVTGEYMAAPCQRERKWEGGDVARMRKEKQEKAREREKCRIRDDDL